MRHAKVQGKRLPQTLSAADRTMALRARAMMETIGAASRQPHTLPSGDLMGLRGALQWHPHARRLTARDRCGHRQSVKSQHRHAGVLAQSQIQTSCKTVVVVVYSSLLNCTRRTLHLAMTFRTMNPDSQLSLYAPEPCPRVWPAR